MSVDISSLAYALRMASKTSFPLRHSHCLELIAAALGYGSLAAYKAAVQAGAESADLSSAAHITLQLQSMVQRAADLTRTMHMSRLEQVRRAFVECLPHTRLHLDENSLFNTLTALVDSSTHNHEETGIAMVSSNGNGVREIYLPFDFSLEELPPPGVPHELGIVGHITMNIADERPYAGHEIDVRASLVLERLGKCVIAEPVFRLESAKLDYNWSGGGEDERDEGPKVSLAQALAEEMDLTLDEAEQLVAVEPISLDGHDDAHYGFEFNFQDVGSPELQAKLGHRGHTVLRVGPWFFDRVDVDA